MKRRSLRVLFASTHAYPPQRAGGIESNTHEICLALRDAGDEVAVLARLVPQGWTGLSNRVRRKLPFGPAFPVDRRMGYRVYRGWDPVEGATRVARRLRPGVAVVQGTGAARLARAFLAADVPTILYQHDVLFDRLGGPIPTDAGLLVLANSRFTASAVYRYAGVQSPVVPPLVRPQAYRTPGRGREVLFVNPHPWKGAEIAFALAEKHPDVPFLFVESWDLGDDTRQNYLARARSLPNVTWRSAVRDMRGIYARARVLLVPSIVDEAWGRVVTEAQLSGIPVLASERGGLPESVGPGGLLISPDAPVEAWEEALASLWNEPAVYDQLSRAALDHSRRPDIQPESVIARFRKLVVEQAASGRGEA